MCGYILFFLEVYSSHIHDRGVFYVGVICLTHHVFRKGVFNYNIQSVTDSVLVRGRIHI